MLLPFPVALVPPRVPHAVASVGRRGPFVLAASWVLIRSRPRSARLLGSGARKRESHGLRHPEVCIASSRRSRVATACCSAFCHSCHAPCVAHSASSIAALVRTRWLCSSGWPCISVGSLRLASARLPHRSRRTLMPADECFSRLPQATRVFEHMAGLPKPLLDHPAILWARDVVSSYINGEPLRGAAARPPSTAAPRGAHVLG